jgi:hypothetical protein
VPHPPKQRRWRPTSVQERAWAKRLLVHLGRNWEPAPGRYMPGRVDVYQGGGTLGRCGKRARYTPSQPTGFAR